MSPNPLPPMIEAMLEPGFYPHLVREPIRLVQTHISYVLLTGPYAYKVKKNVRLPFVDFTSRKARAQFIEAELTCNRRFCPQLYLDTLTVHQDGSGRFHLDQRGEPVEQVLRMRQFPQEALWSRRFEAGLLNSNDMRALGRLVCTLHQQAPRGDAITRFGDVDVIRGVADANFEESLPFVGDLQDASQLELTRLYTHDFLNRHADLFEQRQRDGFIRACHGDLHLNNVCNYEDRISVFDCIEFNPTFANIDTLYDAAFMVMDLEARDHPDLANIFINTYLEQANDYSGALLLPFYTSMRAYVRAKVYALMSVEPQQSPEDQARATQKARHFFNLAYQTTQRHVDGIWVVCGPSGSGKSTVSRWLAQRLGAVHIRSDAVRKHLFNTPLDEEGDAAIYNPVATRHTYATLKDLAMATANGGMPVILDATYLRAEHRRALALAADSKGLPLRFIHCGAPEALLRHRLSHRKEDISDACPEIVKRQISNMDPFAESESVFHLNTSRDWRRILEDNLDIMPMLCA